MLFDDAKKNILKKGIKKVIPKNEIEYPELKSSEEYLKTSTSPRTPRMTMPMLRTGNEGVEAFGEKNMQDPNFIKQLRKLQEKYKITGMV